MLQTVLINISDKMYNLSVRGAVFTTHTTTKISNIVANQKKFKNRNRNAEINLIKKDLRRVNVGVVGG